MLKANIQLCQTSPLELSWQSSPLSCQCTAEVREFWDTIFSIQLLASTLR